jgi:hypothetical protein
MSVESTLVLDAIEKMRIKRKRLEMSREDILIRLVRLSLPNFVRMVRDSGYGK